MLTEIKVHRARTHNLKNVSCGFPHGAMTVLTGLSGSGKSSLAFDTLYAEGQRRYVESLSTYVRQFLDRMERPDVDDIDGIQPAIALEQKNNVRSSRSTVGTSTEVYDFLRLIFAKIGVVYCPECDQPVRPDTPETALRTLWELDEGTRLIVLGPLGVVGEELHASLRDELVRQGYHRLWDGQGLFDLESGEMPADPGAELFIVADRVALQPDRHARLQSALEVAFRAGRGRACVVASEIGAAYWFSASMVCDGCGRSLPQPEPQLFSYYSPLGACAECQGFGRVIDLDWDKIIPNPDLCIEDEAIAPWNSEANLSMYGWLREKTTPQEIPRHKPIREFTDRQMANLKEGAHTRYFQGIRGFFDSLESKKYKVQNRVMLARYRAYHKCPACEGTRLRAEALAVRLCDKTIADYSRMPLRRLRERFEGIELSPTERERAGRALEGLRSRLRYLDEVGLGYLTLERQTRTLSGGETQRINLASALGSSLTDTLYVLDEPTVGLHPRDTSRLISILLALRGLGNTIVVVEHDLEVMRAADKVLDLGPGAGEWGGRLLFEGTVAELAAQDNGSTASQTARYLRTYHAPPCPSRRRQPERWLTIRGASGHNLQNLDVRLPLGVLCCITGVSGSGKTTLVRDTLCANYRRLRDVAPVEAEPCRAIEGLEQIDELHWVDQTPLAGSSRSNPVTYVKAYGPIRTLLGGTREARSKGLRARDFSFNVEGGRCPVCQGTGRQTIDMHFMADVEVICEACDGRRFQNRVLQLEWNGRNIDDILEMTVDQASRFFKSEPKIVRALRPLREVGLGYVRLGQSTTTLSGGEAQRLKLAAHLVGMREGRGKLFVFDEPTTGLHPADLERLLKIFQSMVKRGCSVIVVEHNMDVIAAADWVLDLGPEGGDKGGRIVVEGPVENVMQCAHSLTGSFLKERFPSEAAPVG